MTIAIGASVYTTGSYSGTTLTSAAQTTQATGSTFVIGAYCYTASVTFTMSDSKSNAYSLLGSQQNNTSDGISLAWYACVNGAGGSGHTFNIDCSVHTALFWYGIEIVGGGLTSGIVDQTYGNTGFLGNPTPGPVTTTQANELILSLFTNNGTAITITPGNSFGTLLSDADSALMYRVVSSTGTYDPSVSFAPSGGRTQIITASFQAAAGGPAQVPYMNYSLQPMLAM